MDLPQITPAARPDPRFGDPDAEAPTWAEAQRLLDGAELYWITTLRRDGRPHTTPLVGVWHAGAFAFTTGVGEQKQVNLAHDPRVTVTTGCNSWAAGTDVVVEGVARRVTGLARTEPLARAWLEKYAGDWPWSATEDGFTEPDDSTPWVYVVQPTKVLVFGKGPHTQTAFDLPER